MSEYPRMMYADDGRTKVVATAEDEQALGSEWGKEPSDVHRSPLNATPVASTPSGVDLNDISVERVARRVVELLSETTAPAVDPADSSIPPRRGPGRPPKPRTELDPEGTL